MKQPVQRNQNRMESNRPKSKDKIGKMETNTRNQAIENGQNAVVILLYLFISAGANIKQFENGFACNTTSFHWHR